MSIERNYYVIVGYDLTGYATDKYDDWRWTDEGEQYLCYQSKGNIQLFDDPMSGEHLYFGYIVAEGDEYYFPTIKINPRYPSTQSMYVNDKLIRLIDSGIISKKILDVDPPYQFIIFEECT